MCVVLTSILLHVMVLSIIFNLDFSVAQTICYGVGGLTLSDALIYHMAVIEDVRPSIIYIHLGSNDMADPDTSIRQAAESLMELCRRCYNNGVRRIVISQILLRRLSGIPHNVPNYNGRVLRLNTMIYNNVALVRFPVYMWRHRGFWYSQFNLLVRDGVHLNRRGCVRFYRSIRGGLLRALSSLRIRRRH